MTASALVLFSGGQDSTTCLAWALERYAHVETIGFDYRQRHRIELDQRPVVIASLRERPVGANADDVAAVVGQQQPIQAVAMSEIDATRKKRFTDRRDDPRGGERVFQAQKCLDDPIIDAAAKARGPALDVALGEQREIRLLEFKVSCDKLQLHDATSSPIARIHIGIHVATRGGRHEPGPTTEVRGRRRHPLMDSSCGEKLRARSRDCVHS